MKPISISERTQLDLDAERPTERGPTNIAQVRHLSPFRYPGGKTWLVPDVRKWIASAQNRPSVFVEPFAGGAIVGLTAAAEGWGDHVVLGELDSNVAAVWTAVFQGSDEDVGWLCSRILEFTVDLESVRAVLDKEPASVQEHAFRTIIKNRMQRGGIMAPGAGLVKAGEAGRGLRSRWYPETLVKRIAALRSMRNRVTFQNEDAFALSVPFLDDPDAFFFVDPPYTVSGKRAGKRLYAHNDLDHDALFLMMAKARGAVMMTYDDIPEVRDLAAQYGFLVDTIPMKSTHHAVMMELLITKTPARK